MRFGVSCGPEIEQLERMPESFDFAEISMGEMERDPEEIDFGKLREILEKKGYGLIVHLPFRQPLVSSVRGINDANLEYLSELLGVCSDLGAEKAVLHLNIRYGEELENIDEELERVVNEVLKLSSEHGVEVVFEHTPFGSEQPYELMEFGEKMEELGAPVCLDTGHAYVDGEQEGLEDFMEEYLDIVSHLHLQDSMGGDDHVSIGHGEIDWSEVGERLARFDGTATLEIFTDEPRYFELSRKIIEEAMV